MRLTISLATGRGSTLAHLALVLQVEVPALLLTLGVLQVEGDDGLGGVDGVLALALVGLEGLVDGVERGGGGEGICVERRKLSASWFWSWDLQYATDAARAERSRDEMVDVPFLRDMVMGGV